MLATAGGFGIHPQTIHAEQTHSGGAKLLERFLIEFGSQDLSGLISCAGANSGMSKSKPMPRNRLQPLETGQVWRMAEMNLQVGLVGKLLVHYKLAKPDAVRIPNSVSGKAAVEKYLKKNKAVLVRG